jgi:hypothetical protein
MANAARSTKVTLINYTEKKLRKVESRLLHGIWTTEPPRKVDPHDTAQWESESNGIMTGTEGWVEYEVGNDTEVARIHWNNPYIGKNTYSHSEPAGVQIEYKGGVGDNASVTFSIRALQ